MVVSTPAYESTTCRLVNALSNILIVNKTNHYCERLVLAQIAIYSGFFHKLGGDHHIASAIDLAV